MDLSQTFRLNMWVFTQHIVQISWKQRIWFNGHNSLNFKVYFFKWTCSCILLIFTNNESNFVQLFVNSSNVSQLPTKYLNILFKMFADCRNTDFSLPLPALRGTAKPVSLIRRQLVYSMFKLHFCQDNLLLSL